jgi:hypothetical protein
VGSLPATTLWTFHIPPPNFCQEMELQKELAAFVNAKLPKAMRALFFAASRRTHNPRQASVNPNLPVCLLPAAASQAAEDLKVVEAA